MFSRKRFKPDGKQVRLRGIRLKRKRKFEPVLATDSEDIKVRSTYEQRTVAYLKKIGLKFQYEPLLLLDGRQYRPDFFLPELNLFLEICGMNHMPYYNEHIEKKKRLYEKHNLKAVFISYSGKGSLEKIIAAAVEPFLVDR